MMHCTTDAALLANIVKQTAASLDRGFDPAAWLADPDNVALTDGASAGLFERSGEGVYQGHVLMAARGRAAIELGRDMLVAMVDLWGARTIWGMTPDICPAAKWYNRQLGFKSLGFVDRPHGRCEIFAITAEQLLAAPVYAIEPASRSRVCA